MKKINEEKMLAIEAGGFWSGLCAGIKIAALAAPVLALNPVGVSVLAVGGGFCAVRSLIS